MIQCWWAACLTGFIFLDLLQNADESSDDAEEVEDEDQHLDPLGR